MPKTFQEFLLDEGLRQDALIHATSSQLGTKAGLYMVFAAFVFTAESVIAGAIKTAGWNIWVPALWLAALFSLIAIATLVRSAFLATYRMPPILPRLKAQAGNFFQLEAIRKLDEEGRTREFLDKFTNSLARSIEDNFNANARISRNLEYASGLIAASTGCLLASFLFSPAVRCFSFFLSHL